MNNGKVNKKAHEYKEDYLDAAVYELLVVSKRLREEGKKLIERSSSIRARNYSIMGKIASTYAKLNHIRDYYDHSSTPENPSQDKPGN